MSTQRKLKIGVLALGILLLLCLMAAGISAVICSNTIKYRGFSICRKSVCCS